MGQTSEVLHHLRRTVLLRDGAGLTDEELLGFFIEERDEAAFAALVRRHGPLVWGVCRRRLSHQDAEDAFQATFLVFARKATSIRPRAMVANWLYGVAHQTALQARRTAARRRAREKQVTQMPEPAAAEHDLGDDLRPVLDQEVSRLPTKYRMVILLCDLEGKTRTEAARQLGCPEGTIAGRLARARAMLEKRLSQRGIALSGGVLAAVLFQKVPLADVPTSVVSSTVKAAMLFPAGQAAAPGAVSAKVAALTEGVLQTMLVCKLKLGLAVLALIGVLGVGLLGVRSMPAADPQRVAVGDPRPVGTEASEKEKPMQSPDQDSDKGLRETLLGLEKAGWEALKGRERGAANATVASDFVAIMAEGGRLNRADFLKLLADMTVTDYSLSDVALTRLTPDAAVLTYQAKTDYTYRGEAMKETVWISSAWARRDGKWRNILYHETRVTK